MIKRVQIKNFKCYGDPGVDFTLKRVNFVFGDNSAGKSTFLQMIRMALNHDTDRIDQDFARYVFSGEEEREIKMRITALGRKECGETSVRSSIEKVYDDPLTIKMFGKPIQVDEACPVYEYKASRIARGGMQYVGWISASDYLTGNRDRICKIGVDVNNDSVFREAAHWWIPHVIHAEAARPERLGDTMQKSSLTDEVMLGSDAVEYVNRFFADLNVPYTCISKNALRDKDFSVNVPRRNVGAGIDGLFETALKLYEWRNYKEKVPSIGDELGATDGNPCNTGHALLALEEPESHVNERQISPLMNWLFREANEQKNGQMVVECHSELMALKLKTFIRSGVISTDDLAILFAEKTPMGTIMHEIVMDGKGNFKTKWPNGGFFTERTKVVDEFFKAKQS